MKSSSDIRPAVIQPLGNGAYHYNYNIVERQETDPETGEVKTVYDYDTVKVWDKPTYEKLVKAVIREEIDETKEFSYVNDYNAAVLGIISDEAKKAEAVKKADEAKKTEAAKKADEAKKAEAEAAKEAAETAEK